MESGKILDGQISASSQHSDDQAANRGRLRLNVKANLRGAWTAGRNVAHPWLQVYLGCESFIITGVATQGRNGCCMQWVTEYNLQYGDDKKNFQYYREQGGSLKVARITPHTSITYSVLTFYFKAVQLF